MRAKQNEDLLLPISRLMFRHLQESKAALWSLGKTNAIALNIPLHSSSPACFFKRDAIGMGYSSGQMGSAVPAVSTLSCLCVPSLLTGRAV